jgi:tetratricopeptide (TPR) repeat protein
MRDERSLTRTQWDKLAAIFHEVVSLPSTAREPAIAERCAGDGDLEHELRHVLRGAALTGFGTTAIGQAAEALLAPEPIDLSGRVLGEFRLLERAGQGGMGAVYRAERIGVGGEVAVKVLVDERGRELFAAEQRLHARLVHPNIPQFHRSGTADGLSYFVLEYVEGTEITKHCAAKASPLGERLALFRAVCDALEHAHAIGVVHCDVKPSNILVKADGAVRLFDFGVAAAFGSLAERLPREQSGAGGLTPGYAAPEQLRDEPVTVATDVHALGIVLYELLALRHPYIDDAEPRSSSQIAKHICETTPPPVSRFGREPEVSRVLGAVLDDHWNELDGLVERALAKDPKARFSSIAELLEALERFREKRARDAASTEATRAARVQQFMTDLMSGGYGGEGHRKGMLVEDLLLAAVRAADATAMDPVFQAEVLLSAGSSFTALGLFDRAQAALDRALALHQRTLGAATAEVARDHLALGRLHLLRGEYGEAERAARHAAELSPRVAEHDYSLRASAATLLGDVLNVSGRHAEAVTVLEAAIASLDHARRDPLIESKLFSELANAHYYLGHYLESERYNQASLELDRKHLSPTHSRIGDTLINLAAIAMDQGRYADCERMNREALEIMERFHGEVHPKTGSALTIWARSLNFLDRYADAEVALKRAAAINEQIYPAVHSKVASTLHDQFTAAYFLDKLDEAEQYAMRVVEMERALHGEAHPRMGHAYDRLGTVWLGLERFEAAEATFRKALEVYLKTLPPDHLSVAIAYMKIGRTLIRAGRAAEGVEQSWRGYEMLEPRQPSPKMWLTAASKDLAQGYDALGDTERAAFFRGGSS